jgi:hypothetical protein
MTDEIETVEAYKYNGKLYESMDQLKHDKLWDDTRRNFEDNPNYAYGEWKCHDLNDILGFVESNKEFFSMYCQGEES